MKVYRLVIVVLLLLFARSAFGQDARELKKMKQQVAAVKNLMDLGLAGRFKEAILVLDKMIDSAKIKAQKDPREKQRYLSNLTNKAALYEIMGEFSKAEQIYNYNLLQVPSIKDPLGNESRKSALNSLARLYEKMGNTEGAEDVLEQLVVIEYGNSVTKVVDRKTLFINYSMKVYLVEYAHYNKKITAADSTEIRKEIEKRWEEEGAGQEELEQKLKNQQPTTAEERQALMQYNSYIASMQMLLMEAPKNILPTAVQLTSLRQGKLKLGGKRGGVDMNEPWSEAQRLFMIYKKTGNLTAAEALIKQVIAIDDSPYNDESPFPTVLKATLNSAEMANAMEKNFGMGKAMTNAAQLIGKGDKFEGTDIFHIQNKVLLVQLYQEQGRTTEYNLLADTIARLCKIVSADTNPNIIASIADSYGKINRNKDAELLYQRIINYYESPGTTGVVFFPQYLDALQQMAKLYKADHNYKDAIALLEKSMGHDIKTSNEKYPDHISRAIDLGQLYEATGQLSVAEKYCDAFLNKAMDMLKDNFGFLSEREKIAFINDQVAAFDFSASLLITDPNPPADFIRQTYDQQLKLKGLALNDQQRVLERIRKGGDPQLEKLADKWQTTHGAIAWRYSQPKTMITSHAIDSLTTVANQEEKQLNQLSAQFSSNRKSRQVDVKQIKSKLRPDEAAIEFVRFKYYHKNWTDSVMYAAYVVLPNDAGVHFVPLCEEKQIAALLGGITKLNFADVKGLYAGDTAQLANGMLKSDALYKLVWKPLEPFLKGVHKIANAPAGLFNRIAFNALRTGKGNYLMDNFEIRQYSSIAEITGGPKENSSGNKRVTLYGGIDFNAADTTAARANNLAFNMFTRDLNRDAERGNMLSALPGTLNEVSAIAKLFKTTNISTKVLTGSQATEASLKNLSGNSPWILHLATHGFALANAEDNRNVTSATTAQFTAADNPMFRSGIMMAGANKVWTGGQPARGKEDGIVTAYEIANLDLSNTNLVVLSACETALGDIKGTEGVFGLQRALKLAGVQNMIVSLWKVPDAETAELMRIFYTSKLAGKTNYEALKIAQDALRKEHSPYYWAAFELIE